MVISVTQEEYKQCCEFADARIALSQKVYKARGEQRVAKIRQDIINGTLAEFAVCNLLNQKNVECTSPDLTVYSVEQKSYNADLKSGELEIHVKSQTRDSAQRWDESWVFQKTDPLVGRPKPEQLVAFTVVDGKEVQIRAIVGAKDLAKELLFTDLRVGSYGRTKRAVYYDELVASGIELFKL